MYDPETSIEYSDWYLKRCMEYLDWYFTSDDGTADKDAQKAWFELRGRVYMLEKQEARIRELEEKLRLLEYGNQDILQSGMMPAT